MHHASRAPTAQSTTDVDGVHRVVVASVVRLIIAAFNGGGDTDVDDANAAGADGLDVGAAGAPGVACDHP